MSLLASKKASYQDVFDALIDDHVPALAGRIGEMIQTVEPGFMSICMVLQELSSNLNKIKKNLAETSSNVDMDNPANPVCKIIQHVEQVLTELKDSQVVSGGCLNEMDSIIEWMSDLVGTRSSFLKLTRQIRIIGLNMSIESVRLEKGGEDFIEFSNAISALSERISKVTDQFYDDIKKGLDSQVINFRNLKDNIGSLGPLLHKGEEQVHLVLADMSTLSSKTHDRMNLAVELFSGIHRKVNEIVMGIQFHDITRQQLEHVIETLDELREKKGEKEKIDKSDAGMAYLVATLQGAHLRQSAETIGKVYTEISDSLDEILGLVDGFATNQEGTPTTENTHVYENMIEGVRGFSDLLGNVYSLQEEMVDSVEAVGNLSEKLKDHTHTIGEIRIELDLKSLNAMILSGHLGNDGRAQEALAQEVYHVSGDTGELSDTIQGHIESIVNKSRDFLVSMKSGQKEEGRQVNSGVILADRLNEMDGVRDRFFEATAYVNERTALISLMIGDVKENLKFLENLQAELMQQGDLLTGYVKPLEHYASKVTEEQRAELEQVGQRYTMENERIIHQLCLAGAGGGAASSVVEEKATAEPQVQQEENDIELFDMPDDKGSEASGDADDEFDDNIELF